MRLSAMDNNAEHSDPPAVLPAHQALFLSRGMTWVFWGLFLGLTLFFGKASIYLFDSGIRIPAYAIGIMLVLWGLRHLRRAVPLGGAWAFLLGGCSMSAFALVYLSPFVNWWLEAPHVPWFACNFMGFMATAVILLLFLNLLCAKLGGMLGANGFRLEANLSALSVVVLLLLPLALVLGFSLAASINYDSSFALEFYDMVSRVPYHCYFLFIGPCALAMMVAWKARELCALAFKAGAPAEKSAESIPGS